MTPLRIIGASLFAIIHSALACSSVSEDGKEWIATPETALDDKSSENDAALELGVTQQALQSGNHKACSCSITGSWRDTILMNDNMTKQQCSNHCVSIGAGLVRVICIQSGDHEMGSNVAAGSLPPSPAGLCVWQ